MSELPQLFYYSEDSAFELKKRLSTLLARPILNHLPLQTKSQTPSYAISFVATTQEKAASYLHEALGYLDSAPGEVLESTSGLVIGPVAPQPQTIAFLMAGQGSQQVNAYLPLLNHSKTFKNSVEALSQNLSEPLLDWLFPQTHNIETAKTELVKTHICQPALAILELSYMHWLQTLGVQIDLALGHSLGELIACAAMKMWDSHAFTQFILKRGKAIEENCKRPSAMLAVQMDLDSARHLTHTFQIEIANVNHPKQTILAGPEAEILRLMADLKARKVVCSRLQVSHGFHSRMIEEADAQIAQGIANLHFQPPVGTVISAVDGCLYDDDLQKTKARLTQHALSPVLWMAAAQMALQLKPAAFVQIGPGNALLNLMAANMPKGPLSTLKKPMVATGVFENELALGLRLLGLCKMLGHLVDFEKLSADLVHYS